MTDLEQLDDIERIAVLALTGKYAVLSKPNPRLVRGVSAKGLQPYVLQDLDELAAQPVISPPLTPHGALVHPTYGDVARTVVAALRESGHLRTEGDTHDH